MLVSHHKSKTLVKRLERPARDVYVEEWQVHETSVNSQGSDDALEKCREPRRRAQRVIVDRGGKRT